MKTTIRLHIICVSTWHSFGLIVRAQYMLAVVNQQKNIHWLSITSTVLSTGNNKINKNQSLTLKQGLIYVVSTRLLYICLNIPSLGVFSCLVILFALQTFNGFFVFIYLPKIQWDMHKVIKYHHLHFGLNSFTPTGVLRFSRHLFPHLFINPIIKIYWALTNVRHWANYWEWFLN